MCKKFKILFITFFLNCICLNYTFGMDLKGKYEVDANKIWTIKFKNEVKMNKDIKKFIKVVDNTGKNENIEIFKRKDNKSFEIYPPKEGYGRGREYILSIDKNIFTMDKKSKEFINFKFSIKNQAKEVLNKIDKCKDYIDVKYIGENKIKIKSKNYNKQVIYDLSKWDEGNIIDWESRFLINDDKAKKDKIILNGKIYLQVKTSISSIESSDIGYVCTNYTWNNNKNKFEIDNIKFEKGNEYIKEVSDDGIIRKRIFIDNKYFSGNNMYIDSKDTKLLDLKEAIKLGVAQYDKNGNPYLEDDYYPFIQDKISILKVDKNAKIYRVKFNDKGKIITYRENPEKFIESNHRAIFCDVKIEDGIIKKLEEVYTP